MTRAVLRDPRSVVFGTPSFTHAVGLDYLQSSMETVGVLLQAGIEPSWITRGGDQFIAKVRNKIVWEFFTEHEYADNLFFLDEDIGWPAGKVLEFLERPEPIIVGVYPKRQDELDWPVSVVADGGSLVERDGLVKVVSGPAGFMRIKREVFERMLSIDDPQLGRVPLFKDTEKGGITKEYPGIFTAGVGPDGWYWGEDYAFCRNAAAAGFDIWADPDIEFKHRGPKTYTGNLKGSLDTFRQRARDAFEAEQRKEEAA